MELEESPVYKNLISHVDIDRHANSVEFLHFNDLLKDENLQEFFRDIERNNDSIELNLIKNKAYKEGIILRLNVLESNKEAVAEMLKDEQKTFGGSKLFYMSENLDKLLIVAVSGSIVRKLNMVISRLNKVNEKISRMNSRIKKENAEIYANRSGKGSKDIIINLINRNLKV